MRETELYEPVKQWLEQGGYTVYPEVCLNGHGSSRRADVVGIHGEVVTVVELKTTMSLELIEQAIKWKRYAHVVYVCVPRPKKRLNDFACRLLKNEGIGILTVDFKPKKNVSEAPYVRTQKRHLPKVNRKIKSDLRNSITEHHAHNPSGGHRGGGFVTAYGITIQTSKNA